MRLDVVVGQWISKSLTNPVRILSGTPPLYEKLLQMLILNENRAYILTFTADPIDFDQYRQTLEKIIRSFRLNSED